MINADYLTEHDWTVAAVRAFGILLDTIIVRSVLVTALNLDLGRWMWWPSKLARKSGPAPHVAGQTRTRAVAAPASAVPEG